MFGNVKALSKHFDPTAGIKCAFLTCKDPELKFTFARVSIAQWFKAAGTDRALLLLLLFFFFLQQDAFLRTGDGSQQFGCVWAGRHRGFHSPPHLGGDPSHLGRGSERRGLVKPVMEMQTAVVRLCQWKRIICIQAPSNSAGHGQQCTA